jgi:peptidoglycan hydrolase-like protein with peptidoglycan-binding domain
MDELGISYSVESADSEGMHYAVRTLVELGAIEVLGKLAQVPYWRCLQIESTNPQVHAELNDWWDDMDEEERLLFTQRALVGNGYLPEPPSGTLDPATKDAIARYQGERGLVVTGRPGLELYASLLGSDRPLAAGPPKTYVSAAGPDPVADKVPTRNPVSVALASERGKKPTYAPSEELRMAVRADQNAFLYCYYQDGKGQVARIFPNRFQPDSYIPAGDIIEIPSRGAPFQIRFDQPQSQEEVACIASDREVGMHLPLDLKGKDLAPLPVASLDELIGVFEEIDRSGLGIARLPIQVTN